MTTMDRPIPPAPPTSPVQLSREQILQVTWDCLREHGYDNTTIRRIAGNLGCAIGSIYRYFRDKRELLYTVTQRAMEPVVDMLEAGESFDASVRTYARLAEQENEVYRLMFWLGSAADAGHDQPRQPVPDVVKSVLIHWTQRLGDADAARQAWAVLHGCIIAGIDAEQALAAMQTLHPGAPAAVTAAAPAPVVEPVAQPAVPRRDLPQPPQGDPLHAAAASSSADPSVPTARGDDVTLL